MVCLQIERFPDLNHKNEILIDFPRIEVMLPISGILCEWPSPSKLLGLHSI